MGVIKVEFHSHLAIGDTIELTCGIRDLKKAYPEYLIRMDTTCQHLWDYNPNLSEFDEPDQVIKLGPRRAVQSSPTSGLHYANGFRTSIETNLHISIPQGHIKPDLYLSEEEKSQKYIDGRYWIIVSGGKNDFPLKVWPHEYWQEVISSLSHITFVQLGESKHDHPRLKGNNVIDLVGYTEHPDTGIRDLLKLYYGCDGSLGLISMQMHLAAAFDKACVVVAGAREPASFEQYNQHRYLHNQGSYRCKNFCKECVHYSKDGKTVFCNAYPATSNNPQIPEDYVKHRKVCPEYIPKNPVTVPLKPCWKSDMEACVRLQPFNNSDYASCILAIKPSHVIEAVQSYYEGGALLPVKKIASLKRSVSQPSVRTIPSPNKPIFRMVCNAHAFIGGEKSAAWIMNNMLDKGYHVQLVPTKHVCGTFKSHIPDVEITKKITSQCDILMIYCNDMIWEFNKEPYKSLMPKINARKKIMMVNFKLGAVGKEDWTKEYDLYGFLCSQLKDDLLKHIPDANCFVLPPPVDISKFLEENITYNKTLHLVRHSSQGDSKFHPRFNDMIEKIRVVHPNSVFSFMPGPSFKQAYTKAHYFDFNALPVIEFLKRGSCYWYQLPDGYSDQGPRTIVEAMAIGLPVIADNRWGAKDRITLETGWLCDSPSDYIEVIRGLDHHVLAEKGLAAKQRASEHFNPMNWIEVITS